jgi:fatty-acyl-CoA synthase
VRVHDSTACLGAPEPPELHKTAANHVALSPISFLKRTAEAHRDHTAVIYGSRRASYRELYDRTRRLASALSSLGLAKGDVVATLLPNVPAMLEAHFGVPMGGFVLNTLNTRLDPGTIAFALQHSGAKVLLVDPEFAELARAALGRMSSPPLVVDVPDAAAPPSTPLGAIEYERLLERGDPAFAWIAAGDEWQTLSINYTSGTTGDPKGVVYSHRGAYLSAVGNIMVWSMPHFAVYLWTLPMFHCNGWCFPWAVTAMAGTHVCLRRLDAESVQGAIRAHGVTHLCGAPIIMNLLLLDLHEKGAGKPTHVVKLMTGAAPVPAPVIQEMERRGYEILQVYGLTEVYGGIVYSAWDPTWDALPAEERARIKARQGVRYQVEEDVMVADPESLRPVPADGATLGEVFMRGNVMMKGYLKNPGSTEKAFAGGWFHTGDLGVMHADGYIELKDRSKDIIISGGENISSIEVETALYKHPAVLEAAVVARPDTKWGETPCAFVTLRQGAESSTDELVAHLRAHIAGYKIPRTVIFGPLPKTSTGKIQKNILRDRARSL